MQTGFEQTGFKDAAKATGLRPPDEALTFWIPSDGLETECSRPLFLLMVFQSSANVLSCSRGLVPLALKYSNTADSLTVP